jgi:hypothetical protein
MSAPRADAVRPRADDLAHRLERIGLPAVDHDVGAELGGALQPLGRDVDTDDLGRAQRLERLGHVLPDAAQAQDDTNIGGLGRRALDGVHRHRQRLHQRCLR